MEIKNLTIREVARKLKLSMGRVSQKLQAGHFPTAPAWKGPGHSRLIPENDPGIKRYYKNVTSKLKEGEGYQWPEGY